LDCCWKGKRRENSSSSSSSRRVFLQTSFFRFPELALRRQRAFGSGKIREQAATTNGARRDKNSLASFRRVVVLNREREREK